MGDYFWGIVVLLLLSLTLPVFMHFGIIVGQGKQAGIISEVERSGLVWRPPSVRLLNVQPTYSIENTAYEFAASEEIAAQAERYVKTNQKVVVYYETKYVVLAWKYSSRTIITKIVVTE